MLYSGISLSGEKTSLNSKNPATTLLTNSRVGSSVKRERSVRVDQKNTSKLHSYSLAKR